MDMAAMRRQVRLLVEARLGGFDLSPPSLNDQDAQEAGCTALSVN